MDEIVKKAIKKWPDVPACFGWLGLDSRGDWYLRDEVVQSKGGFQDLKGVRLEHRKLIEFINRNYQQDERGRFYFQNGPQQVFVELEMTPWILRFDFENKIFTHTQIYPLIKKAYTDEVGRVYLSTSIGLGLVHSQDMGILVDEISRNDWKLEEVLSHQLEVQFGFVKNPSKKSQSNDWLLVSN